MNEVTTQVSEQSVDCWCGLLYRRFQRRTHRGGFGHGGDVRTGHLSGGRSQRQRHAEAAQAFLDYLTGSEAMAVFESVGFSAS